MEEFLAGQPCPTCKHRGTQRLTGEVRYSAPLQWCYECTAPGCPERGAVGYANTGTNLIIYVG